MFLKSLSRRVATLVLTSVLGATGAFAQTDPQAYSASLLEGFGQVSEPGLFDNLRLTLDLSSRASYIEANDDVTHLQFVGIDAHNVFSGPSGDWGTLVLQGYLTRIDNANPAPPLFDDGDDTEFVYRIFNFNYTGLAGGKLNFRVGHLEIPFGLEHIVNTNGTLRQYIQPQNLGVKADWGASVNGYLDTFEYEAAVTTGTGNDLELNNGTFTVGGRIGTPRDDSTVFGLSAFHGEVEGGGGPNGFVRRTRVGLDVTHNLGPFGLKGEVSAGRDFDADVINSIGELNWRNIDESVLIFGQIRDFSRRTDTWDDAISTSVGAVLSPDAHWTFSAQYTQDLKRFANADRGSKVDFQVRYRF